MWYLYATKTTRYYPDVMVSMYSVHKSNQSPTFGNIFNLTVIDFLIYCVSYKDQHFDRLYKCKDILFYKFG